MVLASATAPPLRQAPRRPRPQGGSDRGASDQAQRHLQAEQLPPQLPPVVIPSIDGDSGRVSDSLQQSTPTNEDAGVCCFPYLTGNAVFPACSSAGLGFYHFVDLQHIMEQERYDGMEQGAPRVVVLNMAELGFTGSLGEEQVRHRLMYHACVLHFPLCAHGISTGLASSVSLSRTATLTRSRKATQTPTLCVATETRHLCRLGQLSVCCIEHTTDQLSVRECYSNHTAVAQCVHGSGRSIATRRAHASVVAEQLRLWLSLSMLGWQHDQGAVLRVGPSEQCLVRGAETAVKPGSCVFDQQQSSRTLAQVAQLRELLEASRESQVIYLEVEHWMDFPHIEWKHLHSSEMSRLNKHFHRCTGVAPYVRGERQLPPDVPAKGAYD